MSYKAWDQSHGVPLAHTSIKLDSYKRLHKWAPLIKYTIDDNFFDVQSEYNEEYIEDMKNRVRTHRQWDPDEGMWRYSHKKYLAVIKWLLSHHYGGYVEEWPELSDLDRMVREMVRGAKTDAKKVWSAREIVL